MSMSKDIEPSSKERSLSRLWDWIDGPDFTRLFEGFRPMLACEDRLRVEEEIKDDALMIRAEVPASTPRRTPRSPSRVGDSIFGSSAAARRRKSMRVGCAPSSVTAPSTARSPCPRT